MIQTQAAGQPGSAIADALAKAQGAMSSVAKDRDVEVKSEKGRYTFRYATLAAIWDVIRKPLSDNGLSVVQLPSVADRKVVVETRLLHSSGEALSSTLELPLANPTPQGVGSALTYARRYGLSAMLGVVSDDDDDGQEAAKQVLAHRGQSSTPQSQASMEVALRASIAAQQAAQAAAAKPDYGPEGEPLSERAKLGVAVAEAQDEASLNALVERISRLAADDKATIRKMWGDRRMELRAAARTQGEAGVMS